MRKTAMCAIALFAVGWGGAVLTTGRAQVDVSNKVKPESQSKAPESDKRPDEVVSFLARVRGLPPEFAADLLLRLAESEKVKDSAWKRELIEEAFHLASGAQQPVKRKYWTGRYPIDTRAGYLGYAFELNLDRLSLKCRSVKLMLTVDKQQARSLFREVSLSEVKSVPCNDQLLWDPSTFYSTLTSVLETAFSAEEIEQKEHVRFLDSYADRIVSPVQIQPAINALSAVKLPADDFDGVVYTFSKSLRLLPDADRAFWASLRESIQAVEGLLALCKGRAASDELVAAYRSYIVRQLEGAQCADLYDKETFTKIAEAFNARIRPKSKRNVPTISADEIKPARVEGSEEGQMYWQSPKAAEFLRRIKSLTFEVTESGDAKVEVKPLSTDERNSLNWQVQVHDLLKDMAQWRESDEKSKEDYLHQKCNAYMALLKLMPENSSRDAGEFVSR